VTAGATAGRWKVDPRTPCIIGVAQETHRPGEGPCPEPLALWASTARAAADDAHATAPGGGRAVLDAAGSLQVVYCMAWAYDAPVDRLADELGIDPRHRVYSGIGGTTPQVLVQDAGERILRGELDMAVITGAEALETKRQAKRQAGAGPGREDWRDLLGWRFRAEHPPPFPFEAPFHPAEVAHEVFQAWLTFPTFDVARRARRGIAPDEYERAIGRLLAPMSEVAATNPYAWFPRALSAEHLSTPTPENRLVGYPYTKQAVSIMDVDMAATVIVASHAAADALGVPAERRAYLHGWCYATDPVYLAEHPDPSASHAMAAASAEALRGAGASIDDVAHLDLYSCFASSVHLACDALGLATDDGRGLTVTGGLPFSGGAGSNYLLHSIAAMVEVLRDDPGSLGLVSGVGMHMTKHVYGVYGTDPPAGGGATPPDDGVQARLDAAHPATPIVAVHDGPGRVATYTVAHGKGGAAEWGLVLVDVPDGSGRAYGRVEDPELLTALEEDEWVGRSVVLTPTERPNGPVNLVTVPIPDI
jgi:acetyl-CoA C-acetyltransferase